MIPVPVFRLPHARGLDLPERATVHAAGMDLRAALPEQETWTLAPGTRRLVPTGLIVAVPPGFEAQVRPRSGLAFRHGVTVLNSPGTIDADYRGEVQVLLVNLGDAPFTLARGERIAQLLLAPVPAWGWREVADPADLGETDRGSGGYGSTGKG